MDIRTTLMDERKNLQRQLDQFNRAIAIFREPVAGNRKRTMSEKPLAKPLTTAFHRSER